MTFGILRLGDAVQRWLRHPEPSSSSLKSTIKEKLLYDSSRANDVRPYYVGRRGADPYKIKPQVPSTAKTKDICLFAFSFAYTGAKEKAIKKKTPK